MGPHARHETRMSWLIDGGSVCGHVWGMVGGGIGGLKGLVCAPLMSATDVGEGGSDAACWLAGWHSPKSGESVEFKYAQYPVPSYRSSDLRARAVSPVAYRANKCWH